MCVSLHGVSDFVEEAGDGLTVDFSVLDQLLHGPSNSPAKASCQLCLKGLKGQDPAVMPTLQGDSKELTV